MDAARSQEVNRRRTAFGLRAPDVRGIEQDQPGVLAALEALVDPLTRGDPTSPLRVDVVAAGLLSAQIKVNGISDLDVGCRRPRAAPLEASAQDDALEVLDRLLRDIFGAAEKRIGSTVAQP